MKDSHREIRIYKIRLKSLLVVLLSYCFVIFMESGYTWSQGGHKIVNHVAWLQLNPEMRTEAIELIREHVRFEEDFVDEMPTSVATGSQELKDQWVFLQAGAWPDIARDLPSFHNSTWHYINFPHVLKSKDRAELGLSHLNLESELPAVIEDEDDLNILQAMLLNEKVLQAGSSSDQEKAIHLCWLMHLVGDIHQPLHSTSLFTTGVFSDPDGDRGGNQIDVDSSNLHSFWDNALGNPTTVANIGSRAEDAVDEFRERGLEAAKSMACRDWALESHELAKEAVYTEAITEVAREQDDNSGSTVSVNLRPEYEAKAEAVARARIVQAGFRLAKAIEEAIAKRRVDLSKSTIDANPMRTSPEQLVEEVNTLQGGTAIFYIP